MLRSTDFDYFVANGCPYILPVSDLSANTGKVFLNVHPSPLPDLKGADPVPGALLLGRDSGATCHVMDDDVDTGPIVSRVVIPNTPDLDAGLLYQMSFVAEQEAFRLALERSFEPATPSGDERTAGDCAYYTRQPEDLVLDFAQPTAKILGRIKAFSNRSQGARFRVGDELLRVYAAEEVSNPYMLARIDGYRQNEVVFKYERSLLIRHDDSFLKLADLEGDLGTVEVGDTLG